MTKKLLEPIYPGEILLEVFMEPLVSINRLARNIHVPPGRISEITPSLSVCILNPVPL